MGTAHLPEPRWAAPIYEPEFTMPTYNPAAVERRWQQFWESQATFRTPDPGDPAVAGQPKYYVLDMFPYPSGSGLHVGHPEGYTATDILARFKRMRGFHVLHPMGWDAFGLPAEQHAVATGQHPRVNTANNIATFRRQIKALGFSYDWSREVDTTDPSYFRWTQWIFLILYDTWYDTEQKRGRPISELPIPDHCRTAKQKREYVDSQRLAYQTEVPVNWCPALGTVLANEEVIDGKSERGDHPVERRPLKQWMLRITAYADRLADDLEPLDWSPSIKQMQRNWIGRSVGAQVTFTVTVGKAEYAIPVFTTRPDTLFGATYLVLAPEHPLVKKLTTPKYRRAVTAYREAAARKSDFERTEIAKTKTGTFTGTYATNPVTGQPIPVWVADYVLASYGTGAIMAVPGHDERDFAFARQFELPVITVVTPTDEWLAKTGSTLNDLKEAYTEDGVAVNSGMLDGLPTAEAKRKIIAWLIVEGKGEGRVNYKLRDWLFSRQRYWGEPFPLLHKIGADRKPTGEVFPVRDELLPLRLPEIEDYEPTGRPEPLLEKAKDWVYIQNGHTIGYKRETNTMPQWAGSCWYFLRYIDPTNDQVFADPAKLAHWLPVDLYVGGAEHAVLHLLYSRFWHKVLYDRGYVPCPEPFQRLVNQGMILGENGEKMSKSRGNVINPDDVIREYGADSMRMYEMFMGPLEATKPWQMNGVVGVYRFLNKVWRLVIDDTTEETKLHAAVQEIEPSRDVLRELHRTIQKVTEDTEGLRFNTAISAMMEFTNRMTSEKVRPKVVLETFVLLLAPYAPHVAEELWAALGHTNTLAYEPWPKFDPAQAKADTIEVPVQVNGKVKARLTVPAEIDDPALEAAALADDAVQTAIAGKAVKMVKVVPKRLVNVVVA